MLKILSLGLFFNITFFTIAMEIVSSSCASKYDIPKKQVEILLASETFKDTYVPDVIQYLERLELLPIATKKKEELITMLEKSEEMFSNIENFYKLPANFSHTGGYCPQLGQLINVSMKLVDNLKKISEMINDYEKIFIKSH